MKKYGKHINWIWSITLTLLLASCLGNEEWQDNVSGNRYNNYGGKKDALTIVPSLYQGNESLLQGTTRVEDTDLNISKDDRVDARDVLRENFFGTLDVFVKESTASEDDPWFHEYHLKAGGSNTVENFNWIIDTERYDNKSLKDQAEQLLHKNWVDADYDPTKKYDIYVTANNPHTASGSGVSNLTALKGLTTFEHNIYRYYKETDVEPGRRESYMNTEKNFLMDGSIKGWQIDGTKEKQVFDVDLKRATSKFLIRIKFKKDAMITLTEDDIPAESLYNADTNPTGYKEGDEVTLYDYWDKVQKRVTGIPAWKYVNFGFKSSDIADGTYQLAGENLDDISDGMKAVQTWGSNFQAEYDGEVVTENMDNHFIITTYSYPMDWSAERDKAPFILLSVAFTKKTNTNDYKLSYYRIPICDEKTMSATDRNKIYIVDAEIASLGSENSLLDMEDQQMMVEYHVVDWTATNTDQETTTVKATDTKYLSVIPTEYTLKGDGEQSVDLNWYASVSPDDSRYMDMDVNDVQVTYVNYQGTTVNIKGSVTKSPTTPNGREDAVTITSTAPNTTAHGETVTIQLLKDNIIRVTSKALDSRAVKTIRFKVKLVGTNLEKEVVIHHYPLDNIQQITGKWSSRIGTVTTTRTGASNWDNPLPSWESYETEEEEYATLTLEQYNSYSGSKSYTDEDVTLTSQQRNTIFGANTDAKAYETGYTSATNAIYYNNDGYYYWVTRTGWGGLWGYEYQYHRRHYYSIRTRYYETQVTINSNWVDWDRDNGQTYNAANAKYNYDGSNFIAKVYDNGLIYPINVTRSGNNNNNYRYAYSRGTSQSGNTYGVYSPNGYQAQLNSNFNGLNNPNMYVIMLTSTSDIYAIGNPKLDSNYQSNDKVVSPAFMIASQLGANTPFNNGVNAANFCGTYLEVGSADNPIEEFRGKRFTGWRLPTRDEVGFIAKYQSDPNVQGKMMQAVLTGDNYWTLENKAVATGYGQTAADANMWYKDPNRDSNEGNVRCIRDLTLDEIKKLNGE